MERRKIIKKNKLRYRTIKEPATVGNITVADAEKVARDINARMVKPMKKQDPKWPLTLYFFNRPLLYKAFQTISNEKEIPMRKLVMSFASLGLKAYLKQTGQAFKDDELNKYL